MQVVYVVTSSGRDIYSAMTRVSIASLRLTNPHIKVTVVCDAETDRAMRAGKDPLLDEVDEWIAFETPPGPPAFRNRFLKTSLRQRITGQFLFLDSDTVIRDDISPVFRMPGDIAAAPNGSRFFSQDQFEGVDREIVVEMGWSVDQVVYWNGGVLLVSESTGANLFYRKWHEKWQQSFQQLQEYRDQSAMNAALFETGVVNGRLPSGYNAQIMYSPLFGAEAPIWHYYSSLPSVLPKCITEALQSAKGFGSIPESHVTGLVASTFLWPESFWATTEGACLIRAAARDWLGMMVVGLEVPSFNQLRRVAPEFAHQVAQKAMLDSFWSNMPEAFRMARNYIFCYHPSDVFRPKIQQCLIHAMWQRLNNFHRFADALCGKR